MQRGDHLVSQRTLYSHHGIYLGDDQVIHYTGYSNGQHHGEIAITSLAEFSQGNPCIIKHHIHPIYSKEEAIARAYRRLGEDWYDVLLNNCEHFVNWCIDGFHSSDQINNLIKTAAIATHVKRIEVSQPITNYALEQLAINSAVQSETTRQISNAAGIAAGVGTGVTAGSAVGTATTVALGIGALSSAPLALTVVTGAAVGYGVKKLLDWVWD